MVKRLSFLLSVLFSVCCLATAQLSYRLELGAGTSPYFDYNVAQTVSGGVGYSFFEELTVFGGINMFSQRSYLFPFGKGTEVELCVEIARDSFTCFLL